MDRDPRDGTDGARVAEQPSVPRQSPWQQPPSARPSPAQRAAPPAGGAAVNPPAAADEPDIDRTATAGQRLLFEPAPTPYETGLPDGPAVGRVPTGQARWSRRRIGLPNPVPGPPFLPEPPLLPEWPDDGAPTPPTGDPTAAPPIYVPPAAGHTEPPADHWGMAQPGRTPPYVPAANGQPAPVEGFTSAHPYQDLEIDLSYPIPTADDLTARRIVRPREWVATTGMRAAARRSTFGLLRLAPGRRERDHRVRLAAVRRAFGGLRQITVVNPKGGAGKTVATLMLGLTFGQARGGFVLAWDNNETQGTLGMRAQVDGHHRTVRDLLRDLPRFDGTGGRIGELSAYVRAQQGAAFDVLASDESATAGEMLTAGAFREIRAVVGRFYRLLLVDTGNNARAENWQAALDATDQLVIAMSARNDSAETAARLLDHLEQTGRRELVRRAVAVICLAPHRADLDPRAIERHFSLRCRAVLRVPYDRHLDEGGPVDFTAIAPQSRRAWLRVAATVADGL